MRHIGKSDGYFKGRKKGRIIEITTEQGTKKKIRLTKNIPYGCKTPKRICIKCLKTVISKQDNNYDSKICKLCEVKS